MSVWLGRYVGLVQYRTNETCWEDANPQRVNRKFAHDVNIAAPWLLVRTGVGEPLPLLIKTELGSWLHLPFLTPIYFILASYLRSNSTLQPVHDTAISAFASLFFPISSHGGS